MEWNSTPFLNKFHCTYFLRLILPLLALVTLTGVGLIYYQIKAVQLNTLKTEQELIVAHQEQVYSKLEMLLADLRFLASMRETKDYLQNFDQNFRKPLEIEFQSFSNQRAIYDQIRILDSQGIERVRVDLTANGSYVISQSQLQDKSDRYYFKDTVSLPPGQIYFSDLDLNVEHGEIEIPYKPMLRVAQALYSDGKLAGVIVLNYLAQDILDIFGDEIWHSSNQLVLLNQDGNYIRSPDTSLDWNFMFPDRLNDGFAAHNADLWQSMQQNVKGQIKNQGNLMTYVVVYPENANDRELQRTHSTSRQPLFMVSMVYKTDDSWIPYNYIKTVLIFVFMLYLVLIIGSWLLARNRARLFRLTDQLSEKILELETTRAEVIAREKMASLGRMGAWFAHEINTPIGISYTANSTVKDTVTELSAANKENRLTQAEFLEKLGVVCSASELSDANLRKAGALVDVFKLITDDKNAGKEQEHYLEETLLATIKNLEDPTHQPKINITLNCSSDLIVYDVPGYYEQIISNLITNSIRHAFPEGMTRPEITINCSEQENRILIEFSDNGMGIDPDKINELFEPFHTSVRCMGSQGLGLFVVHKLVTENLGGSVSVVSEPREGTTFTIVTPHKLPT